VTARPRIYAEDTKVPVYQSILEVEKLVLRFGCSGFQHADAGHLLAVMFRGDDRLVRFQLTFVERPQGGTPLAAWERQRRAKVRALVLVIKAKLVSVEAGVETFEEAFLAETVMPDGRTVIEHAGPLILAAYRDGGFVPALLPDFSKAGGS
jgi:hypothetical protein